MKNVITKIIIGTVLLGWFVVLPAYADYTWAPRVISDMKSDGWFVLEEQANAVSLFNPWTIFKTPVSRIAFTKPSSSVALDRDLAIMDFAWIDRDAEGMEFKQVVDCRGERIAAVFDGESLEEVVNTETSWDTVEFPSDRTLYNFVCNN